MRLGKVGQFGHGLRILDAAARDDHRPLRRLEERNGIGDLPGVGHLPADAVNLTLEKFDRVIVGPALHVLRQAEEGGAAIGRVKHRGNSGGQRLNDLRRVGDPVPVARHGAESVVQPIGWIAEVFDLLQHRIGQPRDEGIAAEHQHWQAVGMRQRRRRQKVGGSRTSRGGAEHKPATKVILGIGRGGEPHALLVLATIERQGVAMIVERFAKAGHVAVPEDAEASTAKALFRAVGLDELRVEIPNDRLRRRQANRPVGHWLSSLIRLGGSNTLFGA